MAIGMVWNKIGEVPQLGSITGIWDYAKYSNGFSFHGGIGYKASVGKLINLQLFYYSKDGRNWQHVSPNTTGLAFKNLHTWIKKGGKSYLSAGYDDVLQTNLTRANWRITGNPPKTLEQTFPPGGNNRTPSAMAGHQMIFKGGKAWMFGGLTTTWGITDQVIYTTDFDAYGADSAEQKMPIPLWKHQVVKSGGKIYCFGGITTGDVYNDKLWEITNPNDVANWTEIATLPKLAGHSMHVGAGWLHIFGGDNDGTWISDLVISYRLSDGFTVQHSMPGPRATDCVFQKSNTSFIMVSGDPLDKSIYEFDFSPR